MTLISSFEIAAQGVDACGKRISAASSNVANAGTPYYIRQIPVLSEVSSINFQGVMSDMRTQMFRTGLTFNTSGVMVEGNVGDPTPGKRIYSPGHPQADKDGYITMSNTSIVNDMADAVVASKLYEANISVISIVKQMAQKAMEIGRGQ